MGHGSDNLIKGALIAGAIGLAAGLLLAPKSGKKLREDIQDAYDDNLDGLKEKGKDLWDSFQEEGWSTSSLLKGSLVGAGIGVVAALLLSKSGAGLRQQLSNVYEDVCDTADRFTTQVHAKQRYANEQLDDWKDTLFAVIDKLSSKKGRRGQSKLEQVADWAGLGLQIMQQFQKRR